MKIEFPEWLYHGTTWNHIASFKSMLVNWGILSRSPKRDFGKGFYTTIDLDQAKEWAIKRGKDYFETPCVLLIKVNSQQLKEVQNEFNHHVFLGPSMDWAKYILEHRILTTEISDPCEEHYGLVTGPMADNDTGDIIKRYQKGDKNLEWFYNRIMIDRRGEPLSGLALGNQIVFCSPAAGSILELEGALRFSEEGWVLYGKESL
jgi:hypothetical protein